MPSVPESRWRLPDTPLAWLVAAGYLACLALTLVMLALVMRHMVARYLWASTQARLIQQARTSLGLTEAGREQRPALDDLAARSPQEVVGILARAGMTARILDREGRTLAQAGPDVAVMPLPGAQQLAQVRRGGPGRRRPGSPAWLAETPRRRMLVMLLPLGHPRHASNLLQLGSPWRFVEELNTELGRLLLWTILGSALLGVGASLLVGRLLARPLQRLAQTARRVAEGDLSARTGLPGGRSEIRAVASAFDDMVSRLEESFTAQKRFVADASHELKTPLTAIAGMAELLEQATPDERRRALATLQREVSRMSRLVEELLTLSRTEEGPATGPRVAFDAAEMLAEVADSAALLAPAHPLEVRVPGPLRLVGDREALARAVRNLVDNAVKHSPPGSAVTLEGLGEPGEVHLRVRDRGPGIAAGDLPHVFDRFYRADRSRSRQTGGSGLGLAIVRAVVEAHGGRATLCNHPEGGLEATLVLPSGNPQESRPPSSVARPTMNLQAEPDQQDTEEEPR